MPWPNASVCKKGRLREQNTVHRYHGTPYAKLGGGGTVGVRFSEIDKGWGVLRFAEPVKAAGKAHGGSQTQFTVRPDSHQLQGIGIW